MFQKSLLKNFIKSFNTPNYSDVIKLITKNKFTAEDADGVVYDKGNDPIAIIELKSSDKKMSNRDIIAQAFRYKNDSLVYKLYGLSSDEINIIGNKNG